MVPCSSVSSRTMSVVRSALASRAACAACARRLVGRAECLSRDPAREPRDPFRLFLVRAELLVKQQRREALDPRLERRSPVGLPEEPGVAQPRA